MEQSVYAVEAEVEATHWWFVGRRKLFANMIKPLRILRDATVLDVVPGRGRTCAYCKASSFPA